MEISHISHKTFIHEILKYLPYLMKNIFMRYLKATYPGKSTVIDLVAKWVTSILQKSGDSPDQPYVLKTAFTGTAASNIGGGTLTTTFGFSFGNQHQGMKDRERDAKKQELRQLALLMLPREPLRP